MCKLVKQVVEMDVGVVPSFLVFLPWRPVLVTDKLLHYYFSLKVTSISIGPHMIHAQHPNQITYITWQTHMVTFLFFKPFRNTLCLNQKM